MTDSMFTPIICREVWASRALQMELQTPCDGLYADNFADGLGLYRGLGNAIIYPFFTNDE
jgi:hypothetical protein